MTGGFDRPFRPFEALEDEDSEERFESMADADLLPVTLPSGAVIRVITDDEQLHLTAMVAAYRQQYDFSNVADLGEIDRCINFELLMHRYQSYLARGGTYKGGKVDENNLQQRITAMSTEMRQIKKGLGVDKVTRDRVSGKGSLAEYWDDLANKALRFGLHRDTQAAKAHELAMELIGMMDARRNCSNEKERRITRTTDADILDWVDTIFRDEFMAVDAHFRETVQRMWFLDEGAA